MKNRYLLIPVLLSLLVGCAAAIEQTDSTDTRHITEAIATATVTECTDAADTAVMTAAITETEPAEATETTAVTSPPIQPVVLQSDPTGDAPFLFYAAIEQSVYTTEETIRMDLSLVNNGDAFTGNIYRYFPDYALIREYENGQYEFLYAEVPLPDATEYAEIPRGKTGSSSYYIQPGYITSQIFDADGTQLELSYDNHLVPGIYHLKLFYAGHSELFENVIEIREP